MHTQSMRAKWQEGTSVFDGSLAIDIQLPLPLNTGASLCLHGCFAEFAVEYFITYGARFACMYYLLTVKGEVHSMAHRSLKYSYPYSLSYSPFGVVLGLFFVYVDARAIISFFTQLLTSHVL